MSENILEVSQITKRFGAFTAVSEVSFQIEEGTILGLLGPNGAGKTTLLSMLVGIFPPSSGKIILGGKTMLRMSAAEKYNFGFVPDSQDVIPYLTGWEYLQFVHRIYQLPDEKWTTVQDYLSLLHMEEKVHHLLETYSHGQRKKIQLISALLHQPPLLILDEPFSGLDPEMIALTKRLLRKLCERGVGVLLSTHDLLLAEDMCDTVVLLNQAKAVATGSPNDLRSLYKVTNLEEVFLTALDIEKQEEELDHVLADF
ncbi:ABC transporter ATP-binding protein [Tengunoibacter tsumagoiensis]|uniref:ABC transporter n=1 Tax=Tengunoibacter tsumagoiensis TaxID=2014871 RepID=A0A402A327_9CHLR|nr:ABC transporter ATP-binding protein [Tengunoibacter tsumagoiensis]GCE13436.1 ABC transporter [Tengunoibacter tsumagoiensis]